MAHHLVFTRSDVSYHSVASARSPALERALVIGNFDGVHLGHQALIKNLVAEAKKRGLRPTVMTFAPHPLRLISKHKTFLAEPLPISTFRDKIVKIQSLGVEEIIIQRFNACFANQSPEDFIQYLVRTLNLKYLSVGANFRFGKDRLGTTETLVALGERLGFETALFPLLENADGNVSSGMVRSLLQNNDLAAAQKWLGNPYHLSGRVGHGKKLGRTLGFPTLNLIQPQTESGKTLISGIYVVAVTGLDHKTYYGIASVGRRPTVETNGKPLLEVYVLDYQQNCYGKRVDVTFLHYLRGEIAFENMQQLTDQMQQDLALSRDFITKNLSHDK